MLYILSLISYLLFFAFIAWHRFNLALALFFLSLPTYLIRFSIGPLPTTLLEMMLWIIALVWLFKSHNTYHITRIIRENKLLSIGIFLFLLGATVSIFTSTNLRGALGEWKAFYIEPALLFIILITTPNKPLQQTENTKQIQNKYKTNIFFIFVSYLSHIFRHHNNKNKILMNNLIVALTASGLITSLLAIYQHFTGWMVPDAFWENQNTYRVTAWYGFPNAVGLFLAPIVPLAIYLLIQSWSILKNKKSMIDDKTYHLSSIIYHLLICAIALLFFFTSSLAIIYAKSTGALVGLAAGLLFFLFFYNKKSRLIVCLVSLVGIVSLVSLPAHNSIKQELLFQDRSGQIRLGIWGETIDFLKDNPLWGAGLASYQEKIRPYHKPVNSENIEIFHHPHNIFLTMYVNIGLLGLIGFVLILAWFFKTGLSHIMEHGTRNNLTIYLTTSMVVILVTGLVDSPYIKNDLSIFFWLLPAMLIAAKEE